MQPTNDIATSGASFSPDSVGANVNEYSGSRNESVQGELRPLNGVEVSGHKEGQLTKQIESVTSNISSGTFLSFALASVGAAAFLQLIGRKTDAQFVGQWVPTILILGLYNKMAKRHDSAQ